MAEAIENRPQRARRRFPSRLGVALGSELVTALLLLAPSTVGSVVRSTPYQGAYTPYSFEFNSSCASAITPYPANFSFATGHGGLGVAASRATVCGQLANFGPVNAFAYGYAESGLLLAVKLRLPSGNHAVTPTTAFQWNVTDVLHLPRACPPPINFTGGDSYAPPNASYAYWDNYSGQRSICDANAEATAWVSFVHLVDLTNGTVMYPTFGCSAAGWFCSNTLFDYHNYYAHDSGWEFYNDTTYSNGNWSYSSGVYSLNFTLQHSSATAASGGVNQSFDFNYTYNSKHTYALELDLAVFADVGIIGWPGGKAVARCNLGTLGNGFGLPGIMIR